MILLLFFLLIPLLALLVPSHRSCTAHPRGTQSLLLENDPETAGTIAAPGESVVQMHWRSLNSEIF
jgi:hypothetical protein